MNIIPDGRSSDDDFVLNDRRFFDQIGAKIGWEFCIRLVLNTTLENVLVPRSSLSVDFVHSKSTN